MKLNMQAAQEFARILQKPELKPNAIDNNGNFTFGFRSAEKDSELIVDGGIVASLLQLKKSVDKGQSPEDQLKAEIANVCKELKI